jgi:hypothetical protein
MPCLCGSLVCRGMIGAQGSKRRRGAWSSSLPAAATKRMKQTTLDRFLVPRQFIDDDQQM